MRRTSYQKGSLRLADRKKGKVWEFLCREVQLDGGIRRKHIVIGTQEDLPTESVAQAAADAIRLEINQQTPQRLIKNIGFETLVNHYRQHELPDTFNKTKPARESESHDRHLHASSRSAETRGAGNLVQTGSERRGLGGQAGLSGSNWIMKKSGDFAEVLYFVGVPDGI
jgi:hypothetical protein